MTSRNDGGVPRLSVLVSAFACGPNWGSEVGMGWHWVNALAKHCDLHVIAERGFQQSIELGLADAVRRSTVFHYIDISTEARRMFWAQGDWRFYRHYRAWQKSVYELAVQLVQAHSFDLVHQLNMIGFREPGYLWRLPVPCVWGPIGGFAQLPWRFLQGLSAKTAAYYGTRNTLNAIQARASLRVRQAMTHVNQLVAATRVDSRAMKSIYGRDATVIGEVGTAPVGGEPRHSDPTRPLRLIWAGVHQGRKALHLALRAIAQLPPDTATLDILGDGAEREGWQRLARDLGVSSVCRWWGRVEHHVAVRMMRESDVLLFTSLQDATATVVVEALELGLPVICHDTCGFGDLIDERSGIKIPVRSPEDSVRGFRDAIARLARDRNMVSDLSRGAIWRAVEASWEARALAMLRVYDAALADRVE